MLPKCSDYRVVLAEVAHAVFTHVMLTKICVANHLFMMSQRALIYLHLSHTPFFFLYVQQEILILTGGCKQKAKHAIFVRSFLEKFFWFLC